MGTVVFVLGRSGTGKSYSIREFDPAKVGIINIQGKILPFRNSAKFEVIDTDDVTKVINSMVKLADTKTSIIIDDFQYLMANEFMRRSSERGYDKFTEIAHHAWSVVDMVRKLPREVIVYILCHTDTDADGVERLKTIGKMLDEKIVLEGMSTIVLKTNVSDGTYTFLTQNNGKDTVKSPAGMFPSYAIENNLKYVDDKIRNYYGLGDHLSDTDIKTLDESAKVESVTEPGTRRRRRSAETATNTPTIVDIIENDNVIMETPEAPKMENNAVDDTPRRRRRNAPAPETVPAAETVPASTQETAPATDTPRRRRRRNADTTTTTTASSDNEMPVEILPDDDNSGLPFEV